MKIVPKKRPKVTRIAQANALDRRVWYKNIFM